MNLSWGRYRVKPSPLCCSQEDLHRGLPLISIASLWLRLIPWPLLIFFFQKKAGLRVYVYFTPEFYQACCILILIRQKKSVISMITRVLTFRACISYVDHDGLTPVSCRWGILTVWERHAGWSGTFLLIADLIHGLLSGLVTSLRQCNEIPCKNFHAGLGRLVFAGGKI